MPSGRNSRVSGSTRAFENTLKLRVEVGSPAPFVLEEPLVYRAEDGTMITVPAGFHTDLASIPPGFRWRRLIGKTARPGALHDYLYSPEGAKLAGKAARRRADAMFYEALIAEGLPKYVGFVLWAAVRAFGRRRWSNGKKRKHNRL